MTPLGPMLLRALIGAAVLAAVAQGALARAQDEQAPEQEHRQQPVIRPLPDEKRPRQIERLRDLSVFIGTCWKRPGRQLGDSGQEMSIRMSFSRRGEVIGKPRITFYKPSPDAELREAFVNSVKAALERCTPLPFSENFGGAIAGRPLTFRFVDARST
jgi:hypothetical protein